MATELRLDFVCTKTKDELLTPTNGLFCTECKKHVVDFSDKSRSEIIHALQQYDTLPCVVLPTHTLTPSVPVIRRWWSPWRKSAALVALFLVLGDVKALFAQTKAALKSTDEKKVTTPLGYQKVIFTGTIKDRTGKGIAGANLRFRFLHNTIGQGKTAEDGSFSIELESYGGIRDVDVDVTASGYKNKNLESISIAKPNPTLALDLEKIPKDDNFLVQSHVVGGIGYYQFGHYDFLRFPGLGYPASPVDVFGHTYPQFNTEAPTYLSEKLTYEAWVRDMKGFPIPGAKIEMHFPQNITREGFAEQSGRVAMNIQLDKPALHAHITVSAPGYYSKTVPFYEFDATESITHRLIKKPEEKPEEPTETAVAPALPEVVNEPQDKKTAVTATARILLYPNPANETVTINLPGSHNATVQVADENGRIVLRKSSYRQVSVTLDTQTFVPGPYTVQVTCNGAVYHEKLLIVR